VQHRIGRTRAAEATPDGEAPPRRTMAAEDGDGDGDRGAGGVLPQTLSRQSGRIAIRTSNCHTRQSVKRDLSQEGCAATPGRAEPASKPGFSSAPDRLCCPSMLSSVTHRQRPTATERCRSTVDTKTAVCWFSRFASRARGHGCGATDRTSELGNFKPAILRKCKPALAPKDKPEDASRRLPA
jgi:hypothetical protein